MRAQRVDGGTVARLWQGTFDREGSDLFALLDDSSRQVVTGVASELQHAIYARGTRDMGAYELALRAKMHFLRFNEADNAQAVALALRAIELDPNLAWAHFNRGNALRSLGRHEDALKAYDRAIGLDPNNASFHPNRGNGLTSLGRF